MTDTVTALLGLLLQGTGGNNNSWGINLNTSVIQFIEDAIAGQAVITSTGGTYTLNAVEARASTLVLSNTLTSNLTIVVPDTAKNYRIVNYNVVNGFFTLLKCATAATTINVPRTKNTEIVVASGIPYRDDRCEVGRYVYDAATVNGDAVECDGTAYKRATLPDLFAKIGTTYGSNDITDFKVPNAYDTGRFLRSRSASVAVGTAQSNQNKAHTHTGSGTTSGASADHTHTGSGSTGAMSANAAHSHTYQDSNVNAGGGGTSVFIPINQSVQSTSAVNLDHTHTYSFTTSGRSADHTHTFSFTTSGGSADGTEARPESLVGILCIKY